MCNRVDIPQIRSEDGREDLRGVVKTSHTSRMVFLEERSSGRSGASNGNGERLRAAGQCIDFFDERG